MRRHASSTARWVAVRERRVREWRPGVYPDRVPARPESVIRET
ncbi:hypothetical protein BRPE64_CCDS00160 [Caballeronia insecticola]|uniref:Uncharacterized protein n=1 Tax=Caballeronia insecticola TaxID=758793 RepID=R4WNH9_9BURK|nr:hypothetical protein BRPE64_CCDS00160 [Caballeronia insecticola]